MASQKPHLLSLPREIRDLIYPCLTHSKTFSWPWCQSVLSTKYPGTLFEMMMVKVEMAGVPLHNVLLTHSQIKAEYLETVSKHSSAKFTVLEDGDSSLSKLPDEALRKITDATWVVEWGQASAFYGYSHEFTKLWHFFQLGAAKVASEAPNLSTLRIAFSFQVKWDIAESELEKVHAQVRVPEPLLYLSGFPLVQNVQTCLVRNYGFGVKSTRICMYVYGKGHRVKNFLWASEQLFEVFHVRHLTQVVLDEETWNDGEADSVGLLKWVEKRYF
ncbi:hypothetical protein P171DRAFT_482078 [Karstenula rhodostoma CBS 690.94]|uniref:F-box domain-containing protein n=1 Tax=Karstenula rhodostoma CBS 690.94 TaxID=1392251 RepID=A0A9P4UEL5_9PLEO|nr:hypothetical protein P171DRAFT_482078 [Karstenula rhodostoma CBS 690.94]